LIRSTRQVWPAKTACRQALGFFDGSDLFSALKKCSNALFLCKRFPRVPLGPGSQFPLAPIKFLLVRQCLLAAFSTPWDVVFSSFIYIDLPGSVVLFLSALEICSVEAIDSGLLNFAPWTWASIALLVLRKPPNELVFGLQPGHLDSFALVKEGPFAPFRHFLHPLFFTHPFFPPACGWRLMLVSPPLFCWVSPRVLPSLVSRGGRGPFSPFFLKAPGACSCLVLPSDVVWVPPSPVFSLPKSPCSSPWLQLLFSPAPSFPPVFVNCGHSRRPLHFYYQGDSVPSPDVPAFILYAKFFAIAGFGCFSGCRSAKKPRGILAVPETQVG